MSATRPPSMPPASHATAGLSAAGRPLASEAPPSDASAVQGGKRRLAARARPVAAYNRGVDSVTAHRETSPTSVRCFVLTISDTRTEADDTSGAAIVEALTAAGHVVTGRKILRDDPGPVAEAIRRATVSADAVITTGGTGITARDSTYEAIAAVLDKHLDGFGELFRMLSYAEIGAAAMLSRACAGTIRKTAVFSLPGSEKGVRLAMSKLVIPELGHIVRELRR